MAIDNFRSQSEEQPEESGSKIAYVYIRSEDNREAYDLFSDGLGGSAFVRNALKSLPDYKDQHGFFQELIVALDSVLSDGNWEPVMAELGVPAEGIAQYLDEHDEVREELIEALQSHEDVLEAEA